MRTMAVSRERIDISVNGQPQIIGSNRMVLLLPATRARETDQLFVIRGWSLPNTLRMAASMILGMQKYGSIVDPAAVKRWAADWQTTLSRTDLSKVKQNWVVVYGDDTVLYRTAPTPELDAIEAAAKGAAVVTRSMLRAAADALDVEEMTLDPQTAFDIEDVGWGVRVSVFDRNLGANGTIEYTLVRHGHGADRWGVPLAALRSASAMVESSALASEYRRIGRQLVDMDQETFHKARLRQQEIHDRVRDLQNRLDQIADGNGMTMKTLRPNYLEDLERMPTG